MVAPIPTKIRAGRSSAVFLGVQSAEGTVLSDFTGAGAARLWTNDAKIDESPDLNDGGGFSMTQFDGDDESSLYELLLPRQVVLVVKATPKSAELLLRSNWGTFSGGVFTLKPQVGEWMTLAYVESVVGADAQRAPRLRDVFFHKLTLVVGDNEEATFVAEYEAKALVPGVNADLTLPVMTVDDAAPADKNVFAGRLGEFRRDPTGANVDVRISTVRVVLEQRIISGYAMTSGAEIHKGGKTRASLDFVGEANAESLKLLDDGVADVLQTFRVRLTAPSPSTTLTFDMPNAKFQFLPGGPDGRGSHEIEGEALATVKGSTFVGITLS